MHRKSTKNSKKENTQQVILKPYRSIGREKNKNTKIETVQYVEENEHKNKLRRLRITRYLYMKKE